MKNRKTILITGCSSGIGKATARHFHQKGWNVVATMRNPGKEKSLSEDDRLIKLKLDVQDKATIKNALKSAIKRFGKIDVVVNNAGYGTAGPLEAARDDQIKRQFDVNLFGVIDVTRAVLPHFRENKSGRFINISSMGGLVTFPFFSLYHATKWAIEGFSESLQYELEHLGIDVKVVEPGAVKTDFAGRSLDLFDVSGYPDHQSLVEKMKKNFDQRSSKASGYSEPEQIAAVIFKAASDANGRFRFIAGKDARLVWRLRRLLSFKLFRAIIKKQALG
ncbi:MAG: short-chain dehydrogenase/reductase [Spirochaetes bacterium RBG_16_49_21]|nr:MAG: short-chain dehydrogenase/reductase [Spirochaetes bacterium RBG_16_49_21]